MWIYIVGTCLALFLLFVCWLFFERHRAKTALAEYEKELVAKGEKFTFGELTPPMPEGENGSFEFVRLSKMLRAGSMLTLNSPPGMKFVAPGKVMVIVKEQSWPGQAKTFRWENVEADLKQNADTLTQLRRVVRMPVLRSVISYRGHSTPLPHLASSKNAAQWLSAAVLQKLHVGDVQGAIDDVEAIMMINRLSADEPILISQLVRAAISAIAMQHGWTTLHADKLSDEDLARLQRILHNIDLITPMAHSFRGERIMGRDSIGILRAGEKNLEDLQGAFSLTDEEEEAAGILSRMPYDDEMREAIHAAVIFPMWRFVWSYEDERHLLEEIQRLLAATNHGKTNRSATHVSEVAKRIKKRRGTSWSYWATDLFVGSISYGPVRAFRFHTQNELTVTAIALKRYYLRNGKYPASLDQLIPEFLETHPVDWMDGQKLRYRLEGHSFVLWSVGDNGTDEGGTPDQTYPYNLFSGPDIVWPQPASAAEVEAYKER